MILNSAGTLRIYLSTADQHRSKPYAYGHRAPVIINRNQVPPFQFVIPLDYADVNSVKIISRETGTELDRFDQMTTAGLETRAFASYKIVRYPATVLITGGMFSEGVYYLQISNGAETWYSEEFCMKGDISQLWKITYCHSENFQLPGLGHIDYTDGYVNYFLVDTVIGKPAYGYEDTVSRRDGRNFPIQQITFKSHFFELILPEEVIDAMSLIPLHDTVQISRGAKLYEPDEITMEVNWQEQGDLAVVEFEFRTDTVVVVNGRGIGADEECGTGAGECFEVTYNAKAVLVDGGTDYDNHQYTTPGGETVALAPGDIIVVESHSDPATYILESWNGMGYSSVPTSPGEYAYDINTGRYFYDNNDFPIVGSLMTGRITSIVGNMVYGEAIPISTVEVYALLPGGGEQLVALGPSDEFTEFGFEFEVIDGASALRVVIGTVLCPGYYQGPWVYLDPLGLIECQGDYASDADAIADGVGGGEYYCLTVDNIYGMPQAVVKRLPPFTGYTSDIAGVAAVGENVVYELSAANDLGMPSGICRMTADGTPVYDDDADAAANGVSVGEFYVWDASGSGFLSGLIKKRIS